MRFLQFILLSAQMCLMVFCVNAAPDEKVEITTNKDKEGLTNQFLKSAASISIDTDGAHFSIRPDQAKFCLGNPHASEVVQGSSFQFEFTLTKQGEIFYSLDRHCLRIFKVKQITPEKIVLSYETTFDHRSFGKDLITRDSGEIDLLPFNHK